MSNINNWMKEAEAEAKKHSDALIQNNQQVLEQLTKSKENALQQLQQQQDNAIYNLNTNKSTINSTAEDNAKQLNINRLLALKSNQAAMNRAGLGTQGVVGSQVNSINNNYGTNLSSVLNQKASDLNNLEKQKNDTLLSYNTNRLNLTNQYDQSYSDALASINDKALSQYNTVYQNYLAMKQQEYENQQAELARQEAIRQYNQSLALQRAQTQTFSDDGSGFDTYIQTDYYNGPMTGYQKTAIERYGAFNTVDKNGNVYQPKGVIYEGKDYGKLTPSNHTASDWLFNKNVTNSSGVNIANQQVWLTSNGQAWIWNGSKMTYEPIGGYVTRLAAA